MVNSPIHTGPQTPEASVLRQELLSKRSPSYLARIFNAKDNANLLNPESEYLPSIENYSPNEDFAYELLQRASIAKRKEYWERGENSEVKPEDQQAHFEEWWTTNLVERYQIKDEDKSDPKVIEKATILKEIFHLDPNQMSPDSIRTFVADFVGEPDVKKFVTTVKEKLTPEQIVQNIDVIQFLAGMFDHDTAKDIAAILLLEPANTENFLPILKGGAKVADPYEQERLKYLSTFISPDTGKLLDIVQVKEKVREFDESEQEILSSNSERYGLAAIVGGRDSMEDRSRVSELDGGLFAEVYDGHGGYRVAQYALNTLKQIYSEFINQGMSYQEAMRKAFLYVDDNIPPEYTGGATGVVCHLTKDKKKLIIGNAGDSRAVKISKNGVLRMSTDHKPDDPNERYRIEKAGGFVSRESDIDVARVNGVLAVARAIGDKDFPQVSADPTVAEINLTEDDESMILASDGFFDVVRDEELPQLIKSFKENNANATNETLCKYLTKLAYERGSTDNITVSFVALK